MSSKKLCHNNYFATLVFFTTMLSHYHFDLLLLSIDCPDEPKDVQIFNVSSRGLTINWTRPHDNNDPITGYNISYQNPDRAVMVNSVAQNVTVSSTEEQVTIVDLLPGENYTFTIIAINNICPSLPSVPATVRTMEEGMSHSTWESSFLLCIFLVY